MNIVYLLLPLALGLAGTFVAAYIWCASKGQYEDLETPAHRILLDDDNSPVSSQTEPSHLDFELKGEKTL